MCVSVYRHESAGLSIHVNMSKMPEGVVCVSPAYAARKKIRRLDEEVSDVFFLKKKITIQIK